MRKIKILELGSGKRPLMLNEKDVEIVHLDMVKLPHVEVVHNLNQTPWPFEDGEFDIVASFHVLEHLEDLPKVIEESFRVLNKNGVFLCVVPYFRHWGFYAHPQHKTFFHWKHLIIGILEQKEEKCSSKKFFSNV